VLEARDQDITTLREENDRIEAVLAEWHCEHSRPQPVEEAVDLPPHASNAAGRRYPAVYGYPAADHIWRDPDAER
jgi:hypothetical protein